jgi:hypothetical protein
MSDAASEDGLLGQGPSNRTVMLCNCVMMMMMVMLKKKKERHRKLIRELGIGRGAETKT